MVFCSGAERTAEGAGGPLAMRFWVPALRPFKLTDALGTELEYVVRCTFTSAPIWF